MRVLPVLLLALLVLEGCTRRAVEGLPPGTSVEDLPDAESWNVSLRASADGMAVTEIEAPYLARFTTDTQYVYLGPAPGDSAITPVQLRLFDDQGVRRGSVRALEVWLYNDGERVVAAGQARATIAGSDGATVQASRIVLEGERVEAEGSVQADVPGATVQAPRLTLAEGGAFSATGGAVARLLDANATVRARTVRGSGSEYIAEGGARVETSGGRVLESGRVVWNEAADRFTAPGAFSFDGPGERVRGVGLSATADLSRYSFRQASGQIEVRE